MEGAYCTLLFLCLKIEKVKNGKNILTMGNYGNIIIGMKGEIL